MPIALTRSAEEFAARAGALLTAGPGTNLHATILASVRNAPVASSQALFATIEDEGEVVAIALRSPPRPLIASAMSAQQALELMTQWLREDPEIGGVFAPYPAASLIAAAWERLHGGHPRLVVEVLAHHLERVVAPARPAPGALRAAGPPELALLVGWWEAFSIEIRERKPVLMWRRRSVIS